VPSLFLCSSTSQLLTVRQRLTRLLSLPLPAALRRAACYANAQSLGRLIEQAKGLRELTFEKQFFNQNQEANLTQFGGTIRFENCQLKGDVLYINDDSPGMKLEFKDQLPNFQAMAGAAKYRGLNKVVSLKVESSGESLSLKSPEELKGLRDWCSEMKKLGLSREISLCETGSGNRRYNLGNILCKNPALGASDVKNHAFRLPGSIAVRRNNPELSLPPCCTCRLSHLPKFLADFPCRVTTTARLQPRLLPRPTETPSRLRCPTGMPSTQALPPPLRPEP